MSKNVVKVGNHWGSRTADWVTEKTEPPMSDPVAVAVSGTKVAEETTEAPEVKPVVASAPEVPAKDDAPESGSDDSRPAVRQRASRNV